MRYQSLRILFTLSVFLTITISAFGQADVSSATIKGVVTDHQGAAVANATVIAKSVEQGATRSATTNSDGEFQILALRPGLYEITVEAQGFSKYLIREAPLTVGQTATYSIKLEVGKVTNEVTVTSAAPLIEVERTQQSNTIESLQIENLPNVSRDFTASVFTLPGVVDSNATRQQAGGRYSGFSTSGFSIGGANGRNNLVTIDGGENDYGSGQLRTPNLSAEAVQEFQVNRNAFAAEFGFTSGSSVNVVTKSGTNNFHGSAYFFYRSDKTSARERFIPSSVPSNQRIFEQQVYPGFTFGGPLAKNKLFFFTNYERQKLDDPRFRSYTTNAEFVNPSGPQVTLLGQLAASPVPGAPRIATNLRNALTTTAAAFPVTFNLLRANEGVFNDVSRLNNWNTKVDYNLSERDTLSGRFSLTRNFSRLFGTINTFSPDTAADLIYRDYTMLFSWTRNISSSVVNQARAQLSPNNSALVVPKEPATAGLVISGVATLGRNLQFPYFAQQNRYQYEDTLTWIKGNHAFKFGGSYRPASYNVLNALWFAGEFTFLPNVFPVALAVPAADRGAFAAAVCVANNLPAANCTTAPTAAATLGLLTAPSALTSLQSFNFNLPTVYRQGFDNPVWEDTAHYLGFFAQDSWKVHRRLTLDFGGRVDYSRAAEPAPTTTYFSPRFGFAWDVTGDNKTVLRGGSGIFFAPINFQNVYLTNLLNDSGQFINQVSRVGQPAAAVYNGGRALGKLPFGVLNEADLATLGVQTGPRALGRVVFEMDRDYRNNYSLQANLGIQRQITGSLGIEITYNVYRGVHIQRPVPTNLRESTAPNPFNSNPRNDARFGPTPFGPRFEPIDPTITQFNLYQSSGNSIYHGMTTSLTKRFSDHFSFQANYTFSKSIDDQTDFNTGFHPAFATRLNLERSLSTFDIRHNFVFSGVFQSPFKSWALRDISLSPVVFIRSGIPFNLVTGTDINNDTFSVNDRLLHIGRNTGIGPNFRGVNMRLAKGFRFKSDNPWKLEFTVEALNLLNRTNFSQVRDILGTDLNCNPAVGAVSDYCSGELRLQGRRDRAFGQPLSFLDAFDPRRFQFGLKLAF